MTVKMQWLQYIAFLTYQQRLLLNISVVFIIISCCYFLVIVDYQNAISEQDSMMAQQKIRIATHQSLLQSLPSITSLKTAQQSYALPFVIQGSIYYRLQKLLFKYSIIPQNWESEKNELTLSFILSYTQFLSLLNQLYQAGFSLHSLSVKPSMPDLVLIQIKLVDIHTTPFYSQAELS